MFDDKFIDKLTDDPLDAAYTFCGAFYTFEAQLPEEQPLSEDSVYQEFLNAFGLAQALADANEIHIKLPELSGERYENINSIREYITEFRAHIDHQYSENHVERTRNRLKLKFQKSFHYEFSAGDVSKAQSLINQIRELISITSSFEQEHKKRLLTRLEKLQAELHKKISDLDAFWGLIGDAGVVLGKFGKDAKPLVDLIAQLTAIVWATQSRTEGLPSNCPPPLELPSPKSYSGDEKHSIDVKFFGSFFA